MTVRASVTGRSWHRDPARRPASWAPPGEFRLYRAWGDLPPGPGWWARLLAWLLGGWQHLLYIGVTERTAVARWAEHLDDKDWAPQVACWERDPRVWASREAVEAAERAAIIAERPVHNVVHNRPGPARRRRHLPRHVVRARLRAAGWLLLWSALVVVLLAAGVDGGGGWARSLGVAVAVASAVTGGLWWKRRRR